MGKKSRETVKTERLTSLNTQSDLVAQDFRATFTQNPQPVGSQGEWSEAVPPPPNPSTQNGVLLTSMRHDRNHKLSLWLIAGGLFSLGLAERIKVADRVYDWRVVALEPRDIQWFKYERILNDLRRYNPPGGGHGTARFDAELVLRFCLELLESHEAEAIDRPEDDLALFQPVSHFISGFVGTHFGQKGQVYGVKEVFTLGLPGWVQPDNYQDIQTYQFVLREHLAVITSLAAEEGHSELLAAYRDFITGNTLRQFFPFQVAYADFVVKRLADPKAKPPRLFSLDGLNLMTQKDRSFTQITQDPSFLRIAKAINQATVYAGKVQTREGVKELDWQRNYGLAQQLSSQSGSKKDFLKAITDFLAKYEHENLRLSEQLLKEGKPLMRVWTTKDDLDRLVELVEEFDTVLVANLLIAYGYARWSKAKEEENSHSDLSRAADLDEDLENSEIGDIDE